MGLNTASISGNLGQDPEVKYFDSGSVVCSFSVAVTTYKQGNKHTVWMPCKAWGKVAELIGESVFKGNQIAVTGSLDLEEWIGQDEQKKSRMVLVVRDVQLPPKREEPTY